MAQGVTCNEFEVGTKAWTDCIHDTATGGGLMPWIVVIPLGVMVVGMFIGFARQYSAAGRRRAAAHGASGVAGGWLIFVALIELSIGIGSVIGARRAPGAGGGYAISATVLLGVGILLFVIGVFLKLKGRRRARIYHSGLPGQATIRDVHETGVMVNNRPMYQFQLDIEGTGFAPTSTTVREVVPFWMAGRVGPDMKIPVKVDPSNPARAIFDWEGMRNTVQQVSAPAVSGFAGAEPAAPAATEGTMPQQPSMESMTRALEAARSASGGSGWHVGKVIGGLVLLFVLVVIGGGLYFLKSVLDTTGEMTSDMTEQVNEAIDEVGGFPAVPGRGNGQGNAGATAGTTLEVSRRASGRAPVAYSVRVPVTWLDLTASVPERQGPLVVDVVLKPQVASEARIVVTRSVRFLEDPAPPKDDIGSVRRELLAEYGDGLAGNSSTQLAGEPALRIDVAPGADGLKSRQVAVLRGGQVIFVSLTAPEDEWGDVLPVLEEVLSSWRWTRSA